MFRAMLRVMFMLFTRIIAAPYAALRARRETMPMLVVRLLSIHMFNVYVVLLYGARLPQVRERDTYIRGVFAVVIMPAEQPLLRL